MNKSVVDDSIDSFIADLGDSLSYWTSYLSSVKRGPVLQESAIRYAISEFLEVNKHNECGSPVLSEYNFEQDHPYYKGKTSDLLFKASFLNQDPSSLFAPSNKNETEEKYFTIEFKYVRNPARVSSGDEFKRYVKDLCRLHCIFKNERNQAKCYFVVVGEYYSFYDNFCSIQNKKRGPKSMNNNQITEETIRTFKPNGQYADLLPFSLDEERSVKLGNYAFITQALSEAITPYLSERDTSFLRLDISEINKVRHKVYHCENNLDNVEYIEPGEEFKIRLVYSNMYLDYHNNHHPDTLVCIWEVS